MIREHEDRRWRPFIQRLQARGAVGRGFLARVQECEDRRGIRACGSRVVATYAHSKNQQRCGSLLPGNVFLSSPVAESMPKSGAITHHRLARLWVSTTGGRLARIHLERLHTDLAQILAGSAVLIYSPRASCSIRVRRRSSERSIDNPKPCRSRHSPCQRSFNSPRFMHRPAHFKQTDQGDNDPPYSAFPDERVLPCPAILARPILLCLEMRHPISSATAYSSSIPAPETATAPAVKDGQLGGAQGNSCALAVLRPLVAVSTRDATVYFTSDGESFVEGGSPLAPDSSAGTRLPSGLMDLRPLPLGW
jgi:hypothetical protein